MLNFTSNLYLLAIFLTVIPGAAFAVSSIPVLSIVWEHFPQHRNKVTSYLVFFFSLSGIMWNYLFVMLVNPKNVSEAVEYGGRKYFDEEVTDKVLMTNNILASITGLCFVSGSLMMARPKKPANQPVEMVDLSPTNT